jgi:hypothetical protein
MSVTARVDPFRFDLASARATYDKSRWFHASGGVGEELMAMITGQVASLIGPEQHDLKDWRYPEKKEQFLWELPEGLEIEALCRAVALITGLDAERTVLSERHLKVYSSTAPEMPPPHKDRSASTVTVGIGVDIPAESRLALWPGVDQTYNPYPTAAEWSESRAPNDRPELVTAEIPPLEIDMRRGDVVLFAGAEFYHERHHPACTTVLYLKFNDLGIDPLGEDPRTVEAEHRSREIECEGVMGDHTICVSPRIIGIRTDDLFPGLGVVSSPLTFGSPPGCTLSSGEADVLRLLSSEGPRRVSELPGSIEGIGLLLRQGLVLVS